MLSATQSGACCIPRYPTARTFVVRHKSFSGYSVSHCCVPCCHISSVTGVSILGSVRNEVLQQGHKWFNSQLAAASQLESGRDYAFLQFGIPGDEFRFLCEKGNLDKAVDTLLHMDQQGTVPSAHMYHHLLKACAKRKSLAQAKRVHSHLARHGLESTRFLGEFVVDTLVKCGSLQDGLQVFHRLPHRTVASWTSIISGYCKVRRGTEALEAYDLMQAEGVKPGKHTFAILLKACGIMGDLQEGKRMHAEALRYGLETDLLVATCLVDMYAKCGSIVNAQMVFDGLSQPDVVAWTALLTAYAQESQAEEILKIYEQLQQEGVSPDAWIFVSALQACSMLAEKQGKARMEVLQKGKEIHAEARRRGYETETFVGNALISMYGRCGNNVDARNVLGSLLQQDVVSWNAMLAAYAQQDLATEALLLYSQMSEEGIWPNDRTFVTVLHACGTLAEKEGTVLVNGQSLKVESLQRGKAIYAEAVRRGCDADSFVGNALLSMFGKAGSTTDADDVFVKLSMRDIVSWTAMVSAYTQQGEAEKALEVYEELQEESISPDARAFVSVIQACSSLPDRKDPVLDDGPSVKDYSLQKGKAIHAEVWRRGHTSDVFIGNALVSMYGKCGSIMDAQAVFDGLLWLDLVSWNAILAAYSQQELANDALDLFGRMLEEHVSPDARTLVIVLQACTRLAEEEENIMLKGQMATVGPLQCGKAIHAEAWKLKDFVSNEFLHSTLIHMYGKCGSILDAQNVFYEVSQRDAISWNAMLAAYAQHGQAEKVLQLYEDMIDDNVSLNGWAFVSLLQVCGVLAEKEEGFFIDGHMTKMSSLQKGKTIHAEAWQSGYEMDVFVGSSLVSMYGKCGSIKDAQCVFDAISEQNVVLLNAMLSVYVEQGQNEKVLQLYKTMEEQGATANEITVVSILQACSKAGSLNLCHQMHQILVSAGKGLSPLLATTLIHAYGRCASMSDAQTLFDALPQRDVVAWSTLIAGYAREGNSAAGLECYNQMLLAGVKPNGVTFLSLLSACSHAGLVDEGVNYFQSMSREHGIAPQIEHYSSMVDLLGRAGYFNEVEHLLATMPMQPDLATWLCLMAACRKHGKVQLGKQAFEFAIHLQPTHAAAYTMMVNIYADAGLWKSVKEVKELRQKAGTRKDLPGQSWIEHDHDLRTFLVAECNQQPDQVFDLLHDLAKEVKGHSDLGTDRIMGSGPSTFARIKRQEPSSNPDSSLINLTF